MPLVIHLIGPGGTGKTTTGALLAQHLGLEFVDLDDRFTSTYGDISAYLNEHGYTDYASHNVQTYLDVIEAGPPPTVFALSSGFMTYAADAHPQYARIRREIASSRMTLVLLPSLDYETCVAETVRRQLRRRFGRSAEREAEVIRTRFGVYRDLPAAKIETLAPIADVVEAAVATLQLQRRER